MPAVLLIMNLCLAYCPDIPPLEGSPCPEAPLCIYMFIPLFPLPLPPLCILASRLVPDHPSYSHFRDPRAAAIIPSLPPPAHIYSSITNYLPS